MRTTSRLLRLAGSLVPLAVAGSLVATSVEPAAAQPATPGDLSGYAFDQCTAPTQRAMDAWLSSSPFWGVGIYISGDSRGCVSQPNLDRAWVRTQLANGWRLLPITLGPQASCTTRERYLHQVRISSSRSGSYARARWQGRHESHKTIRRAKALGIPRGSTLWYDLEAFPMSSTACRESALSFLSAWNRDLRRHHFRSGVYSSGASGIRMIDDARVARPRRFAMPDHLWIADWNGHATSASSYVRSSGWRGGRRVHQYRGGHVETHGGVSINIDSNWVNLGRGARAPREPAHCGGNASWNYRSYPTRRIGDRGALVRTAQCLLARKHAYDGPIDGVYSRGFGAAVSAWRVRHGLPATTTMSSWGWVALLSAGGDPVLKRGSVGAAVRRVQRAMNAAGVARLPITGSYGRRTSAAVYDYQRGRHRTATGVVAHGTWKMLHDGRR